MTEEGAKNQPGVAHPEILPTSFDRWRFRSSVGDSKGQWRR